MGHGDITVHGFRLTFRDWAAEATGYPNHVVEQALAHTIGNEVEAAYRRGDLFAKRIALLNDWAEHLAWPSVKVMPLGPGPQRDVRRTKALGERTFARGSGTQASHNLEYLQV